MDYILLQAACHKKALILTKNRVWWFFHWEKNMMALKTLGSFDLRTLCFHIENVACFIVLLFWYTVTS